eukprot:10622102-Lingulodinium_polyedra.AAC.1
MPPVSTTPVAWPSGGFFPKEASLPRCHCSYCHGDAVASSTAAFCIGHEPLRCAPDPKPRRPRSLHERGSRHAQARVHQEAEEAATARQRCNPSGPTASSPALAGPIAHYLQQVAEAVAREEKHLPKRRPPGQGPSIGRAASAPSARPLRQGPRRGGSSHAGNSHARARS